MRHSILPAFLSCLCCMLQMVGVTSFFFTKTEPPALPLLKELETLIDSTNGGEDTSKADDVKALMMKVSESRAGDQRTALPGTWELVYTTEKEVNFFKTSWPFAKVSSITQKIDPFDSKLVENFIDFDGGGQFAVTGSVVPAEGDSDFDRVEFVFENAQVTLWDKKFSLPPTGAGWFDTIYCVDDYRLSRDSRGDWSIFKRSR